MNAFYHTLNPAVKRGDYALWCYLRERRCCDLKNAEIAADLNCSTDSISRSLKTLAALGIIQIANGNSRARRILVIKAPKIYPHARPIPQRRIEQQKPPSAPKVPTPPAEPPAAPALKVPWDEQERILAFLQKIKVHPSVAARLSERVRLSDCNNGWELMKQQKKAVPNPAGWMVRYLKSVIVGEPWAQAGEVTVEEYPAAQMTPMEIRRERLDVERLVAERKAKERAAMGDEVDPFADDAPFLAEAPRLDEDLFEDKDPFEDLFEEERLKRAAEEAALKPARAQEVERLETRTLADQAAFEVVRQARLAQCMEFGEEYARQKAQASKVEEEDLPPDSFPPPE